MAAVPTLTEFVSVQGLPSGQQAPNTSWPPCESIFSAVNYVFILFSGCCRLQGMMLGNAVSTNVFMRLLPRVLVTAGILKDKLPDYWADAVLHADSLNLVEFM